MPKHKKSFPKNAPQAQWGIFVPSELTLHELAGVATIVLAAILIYFPSLSGGFIWDDDRLLTHSSLIKSTDGLYKLWCSTEALDYWPVANSTLWIEWRLWGMSPTGYHATNLILHIAISLLIWRILRELSIPGAFLAALIFAVHPVNVESVAWISQRKNLMAMFFFLLSILCYLKTDIQSKVGRWYWLSLGAFVFAMLSKGSVAVLPVLLLGIIWWRQGLTKWDVVHSGPFFLIAVVLAGVNVWFQTHGSGEEIRSASFIERLLGAGGVVWFYLFKAFLPFDLSYVYPQWHIQTDDWLWWLPLLSALAVTALFWRYRKGWSRPFLFAWGFFCVALLPVMGFTDVEYMQCSLVADHYQYIAIIAVITLSAAGWSAWFGQVQKSTRWWANGMAVVLTGTLMLLTWLQSGLYRNAITLYQATLVKNPSSYLVHNSLGFVLIDADRLQEAIGHFQQALRLYPSYIEARNNLGVALNKAGLPLEAIKQLQQVLLLKSDYIDALYNLGVILDETGRPNEAIELFEQALRQKPDYAKAHYNLGLALDKTGRFQEAIEHFRRALRLDPNYTDAYNNLGVVLGKSGLSKEAIEPFRQALRINPNLPEAQNNLGNALVDIGQYQEAIEHYEQALRLKPDYPKAHVNLGDTLVKAGQLPNAIEHYEQALRLQPDNIEAYSNLALAYAKTNRPAQAIAMAQKALEIARSQGQTALAKQIEDWLNSYRASQKD